jgi:hypothetical protein
MDVMGSVDNIPVSGSKTYFEGIFHSLWNLCREINQAVEKVTASITRVMSAEDSLEAHEPTLG